MSHLQSYPLLTILLFVKVQIGECPLTVRTCPCSKDEWKMREQNIKCGDKRYTCILNKKEELIETCIILYSLKDHDGCPFVDQIHPTNGPLLGIHHTRCNISGCPLNGHDEYNVNEMYKYPICWLPEKDRHSEYMRILQSNYSMCLPETLFIEEKGNESGNSVTIALATILVIIVIIAIIACICGCKWYKRKKLHSSLTKYSNYAMGLAWSHYIGFLKIMLPALEGAIHKSKTYRENRKRTSKKWVMLCPRSAKSSDLTGDSYTRSSIAQVLPKEQHISLEEVIDIPNTRFKLKMYRIQRGCDEMPYFCCMEFPSALMSLGKSLTDLSPEKVSLEVNRFSYYVMAILNHVENRECKDKSIALCYDELKTTVADEVMTNVFVKEELQFQTRETERKKDGDRNGVYLLKTTHLDTSLEKAFQYLRKHLRHVFEGNMKDDERSVRRALHQAKWVVLFGVDESLLRRHYWIIRDLAKHVDEHSCKVICLFNGQKDRKSLQYIPYTVALDMECEQYIETLVEGIVEGKCTLRSSDIRIDEVSYGLSWSFYVNYLQHVIPDLRRRLEAAVEKEIQRNTLRRGNLILSTSIWEIVPTSCTFDALRAFDERISDPIDVEPLKKDLHEAKRVFPAKMYTFKVDDTTYVFLGEVLSPCKVLKAMKESNLVNLSSRQFNKLRSRLIKDMQSVISTFASRHEAISVRIITHNDGERTPLSNNLQTMIDWERSCDETEEDTSKTHLLTEVTTET